jgi:hypothetical protein
MRRVLSMLHVNWGGVAAGTVAAYLAGFVWYGVLFEDRWLALSGATTSESPLLMAAGFLAVLISVFGLDWVIRRTGSLGWISGARVGLATAFFFGLTVAANDFIYGVKPLALIPIDVGYILLWFGIAGCMVGGLQRRARP